MAIVVTLDIMLARRKMRLTELSARTGITMTNLSILKNDKGRAVRFSSLDALCRALSCQPGDLLAYVEDGEQAQDMSDQSASN